MSASGMGSIFRPIRSAWSKGYGRATKIVNGVPLRSGGKRAAAIHLPREAGRWTARREVEGTRRGDRAAASTRRLAGQGAAVRTTSSLPVARFWSAIIAPGELSLASLLGQADGFPIGSAFWRFLRGFHDRFWLGARLPPKRRQPSWREAGRGAETARPAFRSCGTSNRTIPAATGAEIAFYASLTRPPDERP
jgi:hypothetical protein